ncbi:MAG: TetR/AcrR family transcriptional regulator [Candidatus Limivivens sp.]|nr:TetR/AcrR family transcriptional regulator [Candidatus Limivivens sp.]
MNEKFFSLPPEKQQAILNAGYRVFSKNSYKKSPMQEIADTAGISKSLLFHYFQNKRELYLFLWKHCAEVTIQYLTEYGCYEQTDLFEMMYRGMRAKIHIMHENPSMGAFVIKAYYEEDPEVRPAVQEIYRKCRDYKAKETLNNLDAEQFIPGLDVQMMHQEMYLASEGFLWELMRKGPVDVEKMEAGFERLLEFWKKLYLRKEKGDENECG